MTESKSDYEIFKQRNLTQIAHLPFRKIPMPADYVVYQVDVSGGLGGDSSVDIVKGRGNAIKILANMLIVAVRQMNIKLYIVNLNGGDDVASIPGKAQAKVVIPRADIENFLTLVAQCQEAVSRQFAETDVNIKVTAEKADWNSSVVNEEGTQVLLACINGIPVGPIRMHDALPGVPMTSNNIGLVVQKQNHFDISTLTGSPEEKEIEKYGGEIRKIFQLVGADVEIVK